MKEGKRDGSTETTQVRRPMMILALKDGNYHEDEEEEDVDGQLNDYLRL